MSLYRWFKSTHSHHTKNQGRLLTAFFVSANSSTQGSLIFKYKLSNPVFATGVVERLGTACQWRYSIIVAVESAA